MTLNRSERIEQLFSEALELPLKQRPDWLREQCGSDADLYSEILDLLTELDAQDYRLERGAMVHVAAPHVSDTLFQPSVPGYQLTSRLAVGGQAIVYEAIQNSTEQRVAVKLLRAGTLSTEDEQLRFSQEVAALAKIQHPHIVPIIDSGRTEQGIPFLVTQFVNGLPVDKYVDQELRGNDDAHPDPTKLLPLFIKIADAVHVAHKQSIIHRDLKPSNILVDMYGEPRLLDFGVAKPIRSPDDREEKAITVTGGFLGSLPWASPEQARGSEAIDQRTDVYSLGVVLYQMLTGGKFPYQIVGNMRDVLDNILNVAPTPLSKILSKPVEHPTTKSVPNPVSNWSPINPTLDAIVMKALEKSPEHRQQSAAALSTEIRDYLSGKAPTVSVRESTVSSSLQGNNGKKLFGVISWLGVCIFVAIASPAIWSHLNNKPTDSWATLRTDSIEFDPPESTRQFADNIPTEWNLTREVEPEGMLAKLTELCGKGRYEEAANEYRHWRGLRPTVEDEVACGNLVYHTLAEKANEGNGKDRDKLLRGIRAFIQSHRNVLQTDVTELADRVQNAQIRLGEFQIDPAPGSLEAIASLYAAIRFHDRFIPRRPDGRNGLVNWNRCGRGQSWYCLSRNLGHIGYMDAAAHGFEQAILEQKTKVHVSAAFAEQYHIEMAEAACLLLALPDSAASHARAQGYAERTDAYLKTHPEAKQEHEVFPLPLALSLIRHGKHEQAETYLDQQDNNEFPLAWLCRSLICWKLARVDEAKKWLEVSMEAAAATNASLRTTTPIRLSEAALLNEVELALGQVLSPTTDGQAILQRLTQLLAVEQYTEAAQIYRNWRNKYWGAKDIEVLNDSMADLLGTKSNELLSSSNLKGANVLARALVVANSQRIPLTGSVLERALVEAWLVLGLESQSPGSPQHLVDLYTSGLFLERLIQRDKNNPELQAARAKILLELGKVVESEGGFDEAMHAYDEAIDLSKELPREGRTLAESRYRAARLSVATGTNSKLPSTLTTLRAKLAHESAGHRGDYMTTVGAQLLRQSQFEDALVALREAQHLENGNQIENWLFLSQALFKSGSEEEAKQWLTKARRAIIEPKRPSALIVWLYHETNELIGELKFAGRPRERSDAAPESVLSVVPAVRRCVP